MEYEITWGGDPEDASITARGVATVEGLNAWVQESLSDPRHRPGLRVLVDYTQLDWSDLSPTDVHERVALYAKDAIKLDHARVALVMRAPADFGIARMEQAYVELNPELEIEIGVFFSIDAARLWLSTFPAPDPPADDS
jgi:glucan biosynthesis protein